MRTNRRGLTVIELVVILLVIGLIAFFLLRMGRDDGVATSAASGDSAAAAAAAPGAATPPVGASVARLEVVTPPDSLRRPGDTLVVRVRATTAAGTAAAGAPLRFTADGGGTVDPASATTSDAGEAEVRWVIGATGAQTLRAAADGAAPPLTVTVRVDGAAGGR